MKYIFPILLALCLQVQAQNRQLLYKLNSSDVTIMDSKTDVEGNIVYVGSAAGLTAIFKTDAAGNMLWSRTGVMQENRVFAKVCIAANGDYIALGKGSFGSLLRIDKDGHTKWYKYVGFSNTFNETLNGVAELPDGNIALCGTNDFYYNGSNSSHFFQGFLIIATADGNFLDLTVYGNTTGGSWRYDQYYFNDLVAYGNRIYVVGSYNKKGFNNANRSLLLSTDLSGNLADTRLMDDVFTPGGLTVSNLYFNAVALRSGQLVIGGAGSTGPSGQVIPFALHTDTATGPASLQCLVPGPVILGSPRFAFRDTGDIYCVAMQPASFSSGNNAYATHLHNGAAHTRKYYQDSLYQINSITFSGTDKVMLAGIYPSADAGYTVMHSDTFTGALFCGVSDTTFDVYALSGSFAPPELPPLVAHRPMTIVDMPLQESCIYEWHLCGDKVCREDFAAHLTMLSDTALCEGDTLRLSSADCYPKVWLRNGALFGAASGGNYLESTLSGRYSLTITNGACFDTAAEHGTIYARPTPRVTQAGDSLVCDMEGARNYQWYDAEGNPIPGATGRYFRPSGSGPYKVAVTVGFDCTGFSEPFLDIGGPGTERAALRLFPNPSSGRVTIWSPLRGAQQLSFYRLDGRQVASVRLSQGNNLVDVKQLGLPGGTYVVVLMTPESVFRQKLVVLP